MATAEPSLDLDNIVHEIPAVPFSRHVYLECATVIPGHIFSSAQLILPQVPAVSEWSGFEIRHTWDFCFIDAECDRYLPSGP